MKVQYPLFLSKIYLLLIKHSASTNVHIKEVY